jgi:hypothetical protein
MYSFIFTLYSFYDDRDQISPRLFPRLMRYRYVYEIFTINKGSANFKNPSRIYLFSLFIMSHCSVKIQFIVSMKTII